MKYGSEITAIIEGGLTGNKAKVRSYTELLLKKMKIDDHDITMQNIIESRLTGEYLKDKHIKAREVDEA